MEIDPLAALEAFARCRDHVGGLQPNVRRLRAAIVDFWCGCLHAAHRMRPEDDFGLFEVGNVCRMLNDGIARAADDADLRADILDAWRAIEAAMVGYDEYLERKDVESAHACLRLALGGFYDWNSNRRLRVYLFCLHDERVDLGTLGGEKSRVKKHIEECLKKRLAGGLQ
jgi:hypothetical protein